MASVLLVNLKGTRDEGRKRMESLGLGYLAAVLEREGHQVQVEDANYHGLPAADLAWDQLASGRILIGFSLFHNNTSETLTTIHRLRASGLDCHITLGGHHATFNYREILEDHRGVDSIIRGEGEKALAELVGRLTAGRDWRDVDNLCSRYPTGEISAMQCRPQNDTLEDLPFPARDAYGQALEATGAACMISSRGCAGRCCFCSINAFQKLSSGRRWRGRRASDVVDEMEMLVENFGVRHINFADDDFFGPGRKGKRRARAIAQALKSREVDVTFAVPTRADGLDRETLVEMMAAGLICVDVGVESFVPRQLELYDKRLSVDDNWQAIELLQELGIEHRVYMIPFDPWVTLDELWTNAQAARRVGVRHLMDMCFYHRLRVYRGTVAAELLERDGLAIRSLSQPIYERHLAYRFQRPEVEHLFKLWHDEQRLYSDIDRRAKRFFDLKACNLAERSFSLESQLALKQVVLDLWCDVIEAARRGKLEEAASITRDTMETLSADFAAMEAIRDGGLFETFGPRTHQLGTMVIEFPPPAIQFLSRQVLATLEGTKR